MSSYASEPLKGIDGRAGKLREFVGMTNYGFTAVSANPSRFLGGN